ncbi:MAG: TolB protein [Verrucomicrobiales bacterium]|jgi:TolB protein
MFHKTLRLAVAFAIAAVVSPGVAQAQSGEDAITIVGERGYPLALSHLQGPAGKTTTEILRTDLTRSGVIRFVQQSEGAFVVSGGSTPTRIDAELRDPQGKILFQRAYNGDNIERLAHQLNDDIIFAITGKPGIARTQIAFVAKKSGKKEIYLCNYDGGSVRQVTRDGSISVSPSISANGQKLAYTSYLSGYADVYLIDLPTGQRTRIINEAGTNTGSAFAPDGDKIALTMSAPGNPELFVAGIDGGRAKRLTRSSGVESSPSWGPGGKKIVYVSDASGKPQLYIVGANGGRPDLVNTGQAYCVEPDWSPDGARLAFNVRSGRTNQIAIYDFQARTTRIITTGNNAEAPVWGADSRHIVYVQDSALFLHDVESGARTRIVSGMGDLSEPTWTR